MTIEVAFKVWDSSPSPMSMKDGMVVSVQPPGVYADPTQWAAWYADPQATPPGFDTLKKQHRILEARTINRIRILTQPGQTALNVAQQWFETATPSVEQLATAQEHMDNAARRKTQFDTYGYDSSWGFRSLTRMGIVLVDASMADAMDALEPPIDEVNSNPLSPRYLVRSKRRYKVPYASFAPAALVARWKDPDDYVPVQRQFSPLTPAQAFEEIT